MYTKLVVAWCVVVLCVATAYAADGGIGDPTGVLQITEAEFKTLNGGETVQVTKAAEHLYTSYQPGPKVPPPPPPDCWAAYTQYMNANIAAFRTWANTYCRPYRSCWCCPFGGLCVAFFVNPTSPRCNTVIAYSTKLAVYEA